LKFRVLLGGEERFIIGGSVSRLPPVGAISLAQEARKSIKTIL
jgi:hypothetical protein